MLGKTALDLAKENNHQECVDFLFTIANPMVLDEQVLNDLKTSGFLKERIEYWVNVKGLDKNARDKDGYTLLYRTARYGNKETATYLFQMPGIDLSVEGYPNIVWFLVYNNYGGLLAEMLIANRSINIIDVNSKDEDGNNLLHIAAKKGHVAAVNVLLENTDINVNDQTNDGETPLYLAACSYHVDVVKALLESGKKIDIGPTLVWAKKDNALGIVDLLETYQKNQQQKR